MLRPTPEQLAVLTRTERLSFELADVAARRFSPVATAWRRAFMGAMIWSCGGRRLEIHGLENITKYDPDQSLLLVANHRSFFDFYVITAILYWRTHLSKRILFPVRSSFFYDHPLGPLVNTAMSGMAMFPPILRDQERGVFNRYSLARCVDELARPGTIMGLHPEGTRNKGDDPYSFLPAQPGVGKVALDAKNIPVIPIYILGMTNALGAELVHNWGNPGGHPIDVYFGEPVPLEDLRAQGSRPANTKRAANRCLDAIRALGDRQRALRGR